MEKIKAVVSTNATINLGSYYLRITHQEGVMTSVDLIAKLPHSPLTSLTPSDARLLAQAIQQYDKDPPHG